MVKYDMIAEFYDLWTEDYKADIPLWLEYAGKCGSPILELACGTGRVLLPLAKEGFEVVGVDISEKMLEKAKEKIIKEKDNVQKRVTLTRGSMVDFDLKKKFNFALIIFNSFQLLLTQKEQDLCLSCIYKHLNLNGRLIVSAFYPDLTRAEGVLRNESNKPIPDYPEKGDLTEILCYQYFDYAKQITDIRFLLDTVKLDGGLKRKKFDLKLRYFFPAELERILNSNGFEIEEFFGNYDKSKFTGKSPLMIFVAKRK